MKALYLKIATVVVFFLAMHAGTFAQRSNGLTVEGKVTTEEGSVEGAIIKMYRDGQRMDNYGIGADGRYKVELNYGHEFELIFARDGNFSQKIIVFTEVPRRVLQSDPLFPPFPVNVNLFTEISGIDASFSENTVLKIYYSQDVDNFISEVYYNMAQIKQLIDQAILQSQMLDKEEDYLSRLTKAELAELRKEYEQLLQAAEKDYSSENFLDALDGYEASSRIFPDEQYPKDRIAEINDLLGLLMVADEMESARADRLQELIKQADLHYSQLNYTEARNSYNRALSIQSQNQHALQRVEEIDDLLKRQNIQEEYRTIISIADNAFDEMLYEEALNKYNEALALKENEAYPKQKIEEINNLLEKRVKSLENQENYKQAMFEAEVHFEKQFYDKAIASYNNALSYNPDDPLATRKIEEIKNLMQELANKTLYDKIIKSADKTFKKEKYEEALGQYQEALRLIPEDKYTLDQIAAINDILAAEDNFDRWIAQADEAFKNRNFAESDSLYSQALEIHPEDEHALAQLQEIEQAMAGQEIEDQYQAAIAEADEWLEQKEYQNAITGYSAALNLKPKADYPEGKIEEINTILQGIERANEKYEQTIAQADEQFNTGNYEDAKTIFADAQSMKPEESYPKEMIAKADSALAEKSRLLAEQQDAEQARLEALAQEKEERYQQTIEEADQLVEENELVAAVGKFRDAIDIMPDEQYPIVRIEEIRGMIELQKEAREKYEKAIAEADKEFENENFEAAKTAYNEAKTAKPEENYPDEMLAKIDSVVTTRERLAAEAEAAEQARLATIQTEKDSLYNATIAGADQLFNQEEYENARLQYQAALQVKPEETYPQQRIDEIGEKLTELAAKQEAYNAAIAEADREFEHEAFDSAITAYNQAKAAKPEESYPDEMLAKIDSIVSTHERLAAEAEAAEQARQAAIQAERDSLYNAAIAGADQLFNQEEYENARTQYQAALQAKPEETYPQQRIDEIGEKLTELAAKQEAYNAAIAEADGEFEREAFDSAITAYNQAKAANPEESYPDEMLAKIDSIVTTRERLAAEAETAEQARLAAIQAERDSLYNAAIAGADQLFNQEEYENARTQYQAALQVKPEETYPQQRIDEIGENLAAIAEAKREQEQLDKEYQNAVQAGDNYFNTKSYELAAGSYQKASDLKPAEEYPVQKIAEIEGILQQLEIDEQFSKILSAADGYFRTDEYNEAKTAYQKALEIKPDENYPQSQIRKINKILEEEQQRMLAEQQAAADQEKRKAEIAEKQAEIEEEQILSEAELTDLYDSYIASADNYFDDKMYNISRAWYYKAWDVKPKETYPPQRIAEINKIVNGLLLSQRDRDYQQYINLADSTFRENQLAVARGWYNQALNVKPNEDYPQEQLQEIEHRVEERMAGQSGEQFESHVQKADNAFDSQNYNVARFWYKKALELRPNESAVKEKLQEIEKNL